MNNPNIIVHRQKNGKFKAFYMYRDSIDIHAQLITKETKEMDTWEDAHIEAAYKLNIFSRQL